MMEGWYSEDVLLQGMLRHVLQSHSPSCSCFLSHTHCCSIVFQTHHKGWNKNVPSVFPSGSLLSCGGRGKDEIK